MSASFDSKVIRFKGMYCDEYTTVYNAMTNKPSSTNAGYQNTLVASLVNNSYWSRIKILYLPVATTLLADSYINWATPGTYNATTGVAPTLVNGWVGDAATIYLKTGWIPNNDSDGIGQDNITIGAWTAALVNTSDCPIGGKGISTARLSYYPRNASEYINAYINGDTADSIGNVLIDGTYGLTMVSRTSSTDVAAYLNGQSNGTVSRASTGLPNGEIYVMAYNANGTTTAFFENTARMIIIMDAVADQTEAEEIYDIFNSYMTNIGFGV